MSGEFDLIRTYFSAATGQRDDCVLGIGDDCALLTVPAGKQLAVSLDTLVSGRHFLESTDPERLGHKALAVNLSDLAAMGAQPAWVTLGMTLPAADVAWRSWLSAFMQGFAGLAAQHNVQLVGGDTTRGPLSFSVQVHGFVEPGEALRRDAAQPGDKVYVSGTLGDAALGLKVLLGALESADNPNELVRQLEVPVPRVELGRNLLGLARAAIDISDGLLADLGHICQKSGVGMRLRCDQLPLSAEVAGYLELGGDWSIPLAGGDDYELAFTVPPDKSSEVERLGDTLGMSLRCVGEVLEKPGITVLDIDGKTLDVLGEGYDHFR